MNKLIILFLLLPFLGFGQLIKKANDDMIDYRQNFYYDGGQMATDDSDRLSRSYMLMAIDNEMADSIEFAYLGESANITREDGIYSYLPKAYSLYGTKNATQTTEADQPRISGNIAPNENTGMKNPNGESRYIEHDEISFAAGEAWSVTTVLNWEGKYETAYGAAGYINGNNPFRSSIHFNTTASNNYLYFRGESSSDQVFWIVSASGKNKILTFTANGLGNITLYVDGINIGSKSIDTSFRFDLLGVGLAGYFNGTISAHIIRSGALTAEQVAAEANFLQTIYPEIPSVKIGDQEWATSNCEMVATPEGNVIANVTEAANVDYVTNGDFTTDTDWTKQSGWTISGGTVNYDAVSTGVYLGQDLPATLVVGKIYKLKFTVTSGTARLNFTAAGSSQFKPYGNSTNNFIASGTPYEFYLEANNSNPSLWIYAYNTSGGTSFSIDDMSVELIGWVGSQDLYDGLIAQGESVYDATQAAAMWCYYNNDSEIGSTYGKLYNWFAVSLLQQDIDLYNAANDEDWGWHVPTSTEFTTLQTYLGGSDVAGGKMKVEGTDYWNSPNTGASNSSGFSALGGGYRSPATGVFSLLNDRLYLGTIDNRRSVIFYNSTNIDNFSYTEDGVSLRLIKD